MSEKLSPESTIAECFAFLNGGEGCQVVPVTVKEQSDDTQLAIFIKGNREMASVIMAELMTRIEELFDLSEQAQASKNDESTIITP